MADSKSRYLVPFRDINVHASASHYAFTSPSSPLAQKLVVERPSGDLRLNDGALLGAKRVSSIAGILGIIKLKLDKYIIVITKAQTMGRLKGHMVYKVISTEFLPLRERPLHDPDEDTYLNLLKTLLKSGPMYFTYSFDITNSFQRQAQSNHRLPLWRRADDRFFWNKFILSDIIDFANGTVSGSGLRGGQQAGADHFILPVMFGMMQIVQTRIKATPITFALITRRSRHRAGTRYLTRGIDEQGHVANYNETEQITILNDDSRGIGGRAGGQDMQNSKVRGNEGFDTQVLSYVQTRGSIPVYWAEVNTLHYTPDLEIRGVETAVGAAKRHFDEQISLYGDNFLVNLVNQRGREDRVKKAYEQLVRILVSTPNEATQADYVTDERIHVVEASARDQQYDKLHYVYFDFHNETKGLKWYRAQILLDRLKQDLVKGQYFRGVAMPVDVELHGRLEIRNQQTAVVRTNCMDCLDRTNVIQTMLARWTLTRQLIDTGVLRPGESADDDKAFETLFRNIWADNADVVSRSYSGTGALKTDFTRTGERTKAGAAQDFNNSVTRYVKNNFGDGPRQDAFDLFLGAHLPSPSLTEASLVFRDRRPILIQAIPYVLAFSFSLVMVTSLTRTRPETTVWPLRVFALSWMAVGSWCAHFIWTHGMLYVNWPKLNTPRWAQEGYQDTMGSVLQDRVIGPFVSRHERGLSNARLGNLEEGKKRIQ